MALETAVYISDLVATNPTSGDPKSQGDDHIRMEKSVFQNTFPNITGAVTPTHTELNYVDGVTSAIQTQIDHATLTAGTVQSPVSVAAANFTSIPSWVKKIIVQFAGLSTDGASNIIVQIGDSGGYETTGYLGAVSSVAASTVLSVNHTTGFGLTGSTAASSVLHGSMVISLIDASTNTWVSQSVVGASDVTGCQMGGGSKSLSGTLDRLRITTVSGATNIDNGKVNILYE